MVTVTRWFGHGVLGLWRYQYMYSCSKSQVAQCHHQEQAWQHHTMRCVAQQCWPGLLLVVAAVLAGVRTMGGGMARTVGAVLVRFLGHTTMRCAR